MTEHDLTLDDREAVTERFNVAALRVAEFSFPNLYLFRKTHSYSVVQGEHGMFISGMSRDRAPFLMPTANLDLAPEVYVDELKNHLRSDRWAYAFPVPEEWTRHFPEDLYDLSYSEDDSDYLFHTEKMKSYPGKKMHKKKNLLNQFLRAHEPTESPIMDQNLWAARQILDTWQDTTPQELETSDYHQTAEALELRDVLGLTHALYHADGDPLGFIIGEPLNHDTFAIHFAKANIHFKGAYQYLFSAFAQEHCAEYRYINMEQDMGIEGLRKTKVSYRPDLMVRKYRVSLRGGA